MPGRATSSIPAKRDRLRGGAAVVDVSPCSLLAASCSLGVAAAVGPGSPQGSVCSWGSPPGAGAAAGGSGAALRGWRIPSLGRGGTSVSRSAAHGAEASGRTEGWGLFGDGRPLHRASNWRRSWGKRGGRGENQLLGQRQGAGKEFLPLCDTWNRSRGAGSEGCHRGGAQPGPWERRALGWGHGDIVVVTLVARLATGPGLPWLSCCRCCCVAAKIWSRASRSEHMRDEMAHMERCREGRAERGGHRKSPPFPPLPKGAGGGQHRLSPCGRCRWGPAGPG